MYPYPRHATEDEPTLGDVRGVPPSQRPPVHDTVLDEPTSEVPVIKPASDPDPRPEAAADPEPEPELAPEPAPEPVAGTGTDPTDSSGSEPGPGDDDRAGSMTHAAAASAVQTQVGTDMAAGTGLAPEGETSEGEVEMETRANMSPWRDLTDPAGPSGTAPADGSAATDAPDVPEAPEAADVPEPPEAAATPPVVTAFGAAPAAEVVDVPEPAPAPPEPPVSEMAKMSWPPSATSPAAPGTGPVDAAEPTAPISIPPAAPAPGPVPDPDPEPAMTAPATAEAVEEPEPVAEPEPEPVAVAEPAPEPVDAGAQGPGEVTQLPIALWSDEDAERMRERWRDLQVAFFDDPDSAVAGAKSLVAEAVQNLADTLLAAQDAFDPYRDTDRVDTETMRVAMRRYREFLDRVLAL